MSRRLGRRRRIGEQQCTVVPRELAGRANTYRDGDPVVYPNCSLQRREERLYEYADRQERSIETWDLYAPPGFSARAQDQIIVEPGPLEPDGVTPARLNMVGPSDPQYDREGAEDHVRALIRRRIG